MYLREVRTFMKAAGRMPRWGKSYLVKEDLIKGSLPNIVGILLHLPSSMARSP